MGLAVSEVDIRKWERMRGKQILPGCSYRPSGTYPLLAAEAAGMARGIPYARCLRHPVYQPVAIRIRDRQLNVSRRQRQGCRIASSTVIRQPNCRLHPLYGPLRAVRTIFEQWRTFCLCPEEFGSVRDADRSSLGFSCNGRPWTVPPAGPAGPLKQYPVPIRCAASAPDHRSSGAALAAEAAQTMGLLITSRSVG